MPDHYATLELPVTASAGEIKKQFYKLSKAHHPDLHPNSPDASARFVAISEAYNTLGSAAKKATYDRDFLRAQPSSSGPGAARSGSYSSAQSSPAGGRPASGLSRRRTQFKGPPPSFYQSGGWGAQGEKRGQYAYQSQSQSQSSSEQPGMGPGGFAMGGEHDVPHFDQRGHFQTHETLEERKQRRGGRGGGRQRVRREDYEGDDLGGGGGALFNFVLVGGALCAVLGIGRVIVSAAEGPRRGREGGKGDG